MREQNAVVDESLIDTSSILSVYDDQTREEYIDSTWIEHEKKSNDERERKVSPMRTRSIA